MRREAGMFATFTRCGCPGWIAAAMIAAVLGACAVEDAETPGPAAVGDVGSAAPSACVPGRQTACTCADATAGVALCAADGSGFGACDCAALPGIVPVPTTTPIDPSGTTGAAGDSAEPMTDPDAIATQVRITEIALYQVVEIALARDGEPVIERNAPVVVGKDALVRVFVEPLAGFVPRDLVAELELFSADPGVTPLSVTRNVATASTRAELESTFNFELPGAWITRDLQYRVSLRETSASLAAGDAADAAARFPTDPAYVAELAARDAGPLRIMIVPYRYNADGSGRLPATDAAEMQAYVESLLAYYPIVDVELTVHEPVDYGQALGPTTGWSEWLTSHCQLRNDESPDPTVLYYGMMSPTDGWQAYGGGTAGISNVPGPAGNYGRCSVGLGFSGQAGTMTHEIGHALGLPHAPCGTEGGPFPYPEAKIGSWGYGQVSGTLKNPDELYDLMSYCNPTFISDYNYERVFERVRYLNLQFGGLEGRDESFTRIVVEPDATALSMGLVTIAGAPGGAEDLRPVVSIDASGHALGALDAYFFPFADGGGLWLVPEAPGAVAVAIEGVGDVPLW